VLTFAFMCFVRISDQTNKHFVNRGGVSCAVRTESYEPDTFRF